MRTRLIGAVATVLLAGSGLAGVAGVAGVAAPPAGATLAATGVYTGPSPFTGVAGVPKELTSGLHAQIFNDADSGPAVHSTTGPYWALDSVDQHIQIWQLPQQSDSYANGACKAPAGCYYISVTDSGTSNFLAGDPSPGYGLPQGANGTAAMTGGWDAYLSAADYTLAGNVPLTGVVGSLQPTTPASGVVNNNQVFGDLGGTNTVAMGVGTVKKGISSYAWLDTYFTTTTATSAENQVIAHQNWGWGYTLQKPPPYDAYTQWYDTGSGPDHYGQPGALGDGVYNGFNDVYIPAIEDGNCTVAMGPVTNVPVQDTVGVPIPAYSLSATTGDGSPVTWTSTFVQNNLPPGVTLSSTNGGAPVLSGTPQAPGGATYTVTASDQCYPDSNPLAVVYNLVNYSGFTLSGLTVDNPGTATLQGESGNPDNFLSVLGSLPSTFQGSVGLSFANGSASCNYQIGINLSNGAPPAVLSCFDWRGLTFIVTQNGPPGLQGPAGAPGPAGPPGPQGPAGTPSPQTSPGGQNQQGQGTQQGGPDAGNTPKPLTTSTPQSTPKVTSALLQLRWSITNPKGRAFKLEATTVPGGRTVNVQSCWWTKKANGKPYHLVGCGRYPIDHVYHLTPREAIKARGYAEGIWSHPLVLVG